MTEGRRPVAQIVAFAATFAVLLYYALRGGAYDTVVRHEAAIALWWAIGLGWASGLLPRFQRPRGGVVPLAALAGLAAWTAASLSWTSSDSRTLAEAARVLHHAGVVVLVWSVFGRRTWRAAAAGAVAAALAVSALALGSRLLPDLFPENQIRAVFDTNRLTYPFNYWNGVAAWCAMSVALAVAVGAHARIVAVRALAAAFVPVCLLAGYLTYSRQAALGAAVAVVAVFALGRNRWTTLLNAAAGAAGGGLAILVARGEPAIVDATGATGGGRVLAFVLAGAALSAAVATLTALAGADRLRMPRAAARTAVPVALLALGVAAATVGRPAIAEGWDQFRNVSESHSQSSDPAARLTSLQGARYEHWRLAVKAFRADPGQGLGAGTYEYWWNREGGAEFVRDAHSLYFESAAELGLPGLALVLLAVGGLLGAALARRRRIRDPAAIGLHAGLTAAFVVYLLHAGIDWMWESTAVSVLALGAVALAASRSRRHEGPPVLAARIAVPALAAVAIIVQVPNLASTSAVRDSRRAVAAGDGALAAARAADAVASAPWAAEGYVQRALVAEAGGDLAGAAEDLARAIEREPLDWRPRVLLARVEAERGRVAAARAAFRAARRLRPRLQFGIPPG